MLQDLPEIARRYRHGFLARPNESLFSFLSEPLPEQEACDSSSEIAEAREMVQKTIAVDTSSIPIEYNKKLLWPWEAACCCIDEKGTAVVYLGKRGEKSPPIIAHELIHAIRGRLNAPIFEEHLAYAICHKMFPRKSSWWRTVTGPLFLSPSEIIAFLSSVWIVCLLPLFFDWEPHLFFFLPSGIFLLYAFGRLAFRWQRWEQAVKILKDLFPSSFYSVLVRLGDKEIVWLSSLDPSTCRRSVEEKAKSEWRWQFFLEEERE